MRQDRVKYAKLRTEKTIELAWGSHTELITFGTVRGFFQGLAGKISRTETGIQIEKEFYFLTEDMIALSAELMEIDNCSYRVIEVETNGRKILFKLLKEGD